MVGPLKTYAERPELFVFRVFTAENKKIFTLATSVPLWFNFLFFSAILASSAVKIFYFFKKLKYYEIFYSLQSFAVKYQIGESVFMWIGEKIKNWLVDKLIELLIWDKDLPSTPFCDFEQTRFELRPCDVLLVEGRSRISDVIKTITLSRWTHAALYIGRLNDIENHGIRKIVRHYYMGDPDVQLLIEALVGKGTIISPITKYQYHNLRICRPRGLTPHDSQKIVEHAVKCVGMGYNTRQLLDLARFLFPYGVLPRRWRSSLFEKKIGDSTRTICSTMLAEAFAAVQFPVLPFVQSVEGGEFRWFNRNSSLFIPSDFDYSPYFEIIKYPFFGDDLAIYRRLPWDKTGVIYSDERQIQLEMIRNGSVHGNNGKKEPGEPAGE